MRPILATDNISDGFRSNAELSTKCCQTAVLVDVPTANIPNLIFSKFGSTTGRTFSIRQAALCLHIIHVVLMSTQEQMIGIYARGVVAAVAYFHALRQFTIRNQIGVTVRSIGVARKHDCAVAARVLISSPQPTSAGAGSLVNLAPKVGSMFNFWYSSHVSSLLVRGLITPRQFIPARGFNVPNYNTNGGMG